MPSAATPPCPASRAADARAVWAAGAVLVLAALAAYANTLRAPFVYDDLLAIPGNPTIRQLWPLTDVLLPPPAGGGLTVSGRPVLNLSLALNHAISGEAPWSYHLVNALIHAGAGLLLFGLVRRTLLLPPAGAGTFRVAAPDATPFAFAVSGLWTLHPLATQAVTYTVQRAESLMALWFLLTIYAFARGATAASRAARGWQLASIGACLLGMATKEVMATAPLLVLLYDRTFAAGGFAGAWRARRGYYLALAATWLLLGALVLSTGGNRGGTVGLGVGVPLWAYPLTQFEAVARYLALAPWPHPLVFEYGTFWVQRASDLLPHALVVLPLLAATVMALWRHPVVGFCGVWFFLILAPTSLAPGTIQMIVEHRAYLPLAAIVALLAGGIYRTLGRHAFPVLAGIALAFGLLTVRRNHDYRSALALWGDTVAKRPMNPRAHEGFAEALAATDRLDAAIAHYAEAVRLVPTESNYHYNLALTLAQAGRLDEAIRHYELALRLSPDEPRAHNNLAIALGRAGRLAEALPHYAAAVRLRPDDAQLRYNFGIGLQRVGRLVDAVAEYEAALRLRPDHADAHYNLGSALTRLGRPEAALAHYAEAVRLRPDDLETRLALAGAMLLAGNADEARRQFQQITVAHPDSIAAEFGLGNALAAGRHFTEAVARFEAVLRRAPDHANAHFKLGNALLDLDRVSEALPHYQTAVRLHPADAEAHHNLGVACARLERWEEARRAFETALRLRPDYREAQRHLEQLRQVLPR